MDPSPHRIDELELHVAALMEEVDRYRTASADALEQLDWCIGYLTSTRQYGHARALSRNRAYIRTALLRRPELPAPTPDPATVESG